MSYVIETERCNCCGDCAAACPMEAVSVDSGVFTIAPDVCTDCGTCADICPRDAVRGSL